MTNDRIRRFARAAGVALVAVLAPGLLASCAADGVMQPRVDTLQSKEEIRSTLLELTDIIDSGDASRLQQLSQRVESNFRLTVTNLQGQQQQYTGLSEVVQSFGQILATTQPNVAPSAISVDVSGNNATAMMTMISAGDVPQELAPNVPANQRALMFADVRATFTRQGAQGQWRLNSMEVMHEIALLGTDPGN